MSKPYLFLQRVGAVLRPEDPGLQPGCISALQRFRAAGYQLVVLDDPDAVQEPGQAQLMEFIESVLASEGVEFNTVQRCTHNAAAGCDCALPGIGLVADFIADPALDRSISAVVGAGEPLLKLARAMGLAGYRIDDGQRWNDVAHSLLDRPRQAEVRRTTRETDILVRVDLDQAAEPSIETGIGFFDHMLEQLGKHGGFALTVACRGDLEVDEHHTVEDVALATGQALREALGDKRGIARYGFLLPMDEAETRVSLDLSGRACFVFEGEFPRSEVGSLPTELVIHFFRSLSEALGAALHVSVRGENAHHMVEACFKGMARTLRQAFARSGSELPTTKGAL